jgi:adenosylcobinamide-GDP ribazoletransferase
VNAQWRLFLAALGFVTRRPVDGTGSDDAAPPQGATRFIPLVGILLGGAGAVAYWSAAQVWPTSIAVVLAMLVTVLATAAARSADTPAAGLGALYWVFVVFVKYDALMALSAARVPFTLPADVALGLILIAGQAASRALVVSVMATQVPAVHRVATNDLIVALIVGLAPATLLGIPGLIGLVTAICMRLVLTAAILPRRQYPFRQSLEITQQLTELSFYLGALATWRYI